DSTRCETAWRTYCSANHRCGGTLARRGTGSHGFQNWGDDDAKARNARRKPRRMLLCARPSSCRAGRSARTNEDCQMRIDFYGDRGAACFLLLGALAAASGASAAPGDRITRSATVLRAEGGTESSSAVRGDGASVVVWVTPNGIEAQRYLP